MSSPLLEYPCRARRRPLVSSRLCCRRMRERMRYTCVWVREWRYASESASGVVSHEKYHPYLGIGSPGAAQLHVTETFRRSGGGLKNDLGHTVLQIVTKCLPGLFTWVKCDSDEGSISVRILMNCSGTVLLRDTKSWIRLEEQPRSLQRVRNFPHCPRFEAPVDGDIPYSAKSRNFTIYCTILKKMLYMVMLPSTVQNRGLRSLVNFPSLSAPGLVSAWVTGRAQTFRRRMEQPRSRVRSHGTDNPAGRSPSRYRRPQIRTIAWTLLLVVARYALTSPTVTGVHGCKAWQSRAKATNWVVDRVNIALRHRSREGWSFALDTKIARGCKYAPAPEDSSRLSRDTVPRRGRAT